MTLEEIEAYRDEEKVYESVPEWTLKVEPLEEVLKIPHISALASSTVTRTEISRK
jgi:hypothetical protein